jgi:hypothetical protein
MRRRRGCLASQGNCIYGTSPRGPAAFSPLRHFSNSLLEIRTTRLHAGTAFCLRSVLCVAPGCCRHVPRCHRLRTSGLFTEVLLTDCWKDLTRGNAMLTAWYRERLQRHAFQATLGAWGPGADALQYGPSRFTGWWLRVALRLSPS